MSLTSSEFKYERISSIIQNITPMVQDHIFEIYCNRAAHMVLTAALTAHT